MSEPANGSASPHPAGCSIEALDGAMCGRYLAWVLGGQGVTVAEGVIETSSDVPIRGVTGEQHAELPIGTDKVVWCLAHCDDGITWGRYDVGTKAWRLGSTVVPTVSPRIRYETLQELRIFGQSGEVLIWRADSELRGRLLLDTNPSTGKDDPLRPSDERRILRGDSVRSNAERDFTYIADSAGAEQVIPLKVANSDLNARRVRLHMRHYWEQDPDIGAVRIAATRLVELSVEVNS